MKKMSILFLIGMFLSTYAAAGVEPATFDIPYLPEPPEIDGKIEEEEWQRAVSLTGGIWPVGKEGLIAARQCVYWLGWDEDYMYLAARSYAPGPLKFETGSNSDNLELVFFPLSSARLGRELYKFYLSYDEFFLPGEYRPLPGDGPSSPEGRGRLRAGWAPEVEFAGRVMPDPERRLGADTEIWELEARMPRGNFGIERPNKAGDTWHMLLVRNYLAPKEQTHLPVAEGFFNPRGFIRGRLTRQQPSVQFRDVLPLLRGKAGVGLQFCNPAGDSAVFVKNIVIRNLQSGEAIHEAKLEFKVAPGEILQHIPRDAIEGLSGDERARICLTIQADRRGDILRYQAEYKLDENP